VNDQERMKRISRRSFFWAAAALGGTYEVWRKLNDSANAAGLIAPLRKGLEYSQGVWSKAIDPYRKVRTYTEADVTTERLNSFIGMPGNLDAGAWRLAVEGVYGRTKPVELTLSEILAMPSLTMTTEFFCIEGWSVIQTFKGVPFVEFMKRYPPGTLSGKAPDVDGNPDDLSPYVYMETPPKKRGEVASAQDYSDRPYYVGLDMRSARHVQTMLCYEMNGKPLTPEHGAPLRLVIPVKYGVKNIKRIGLIRYQKTQPGDYWAEQGYDWFAGV